MSTADNRADGVGGLMDEHLRSHQAEIHAAAAAEAYQLDLLGPVTPEEFLEAKERLPDFSTNLEVLREARRGRPKGSRNKHTADFRKFLLSLGPHPVIKMVEIVNTDPILLIEQSKAVDPEKRRMTLLEAMSLQQRIRDSLMDRLEGKAPQQHDVRIETDGIMIFPGITDPEKLAANIVEDDVIEGSFIEIDDGDAQ